MKIFYNRYIPVRGFDAMNFFGMLLVRRGVRLDANMLAHERIHTQQMKELLFVGFYLWYVVEWLVRCLVLRNGRAAYYHVSFEREAYAFQHEADYRCTRRRFAWTKFLFVK